MTSAAFRSLCDGHRMASIVPALLLDRRLAGGAPRMAGIVAAVKTPSKTTTTTR
jgi:hypothetical protein